MLSIYQIRRFVNFFMPKYQPAGQPRKQVFLSHRSSSISSLIPGEPDGQPALLLCIRSDFSIRVCKSGLVLKYTPPLKFFDISYGYHPFDLPVNFSVQVENLNLL